MRLASLESKEIGVSTPLCSDARVNGCAPTGAIIVAFSASYVRKSKESTHPSSFCNLVRGFAALGPSGGLVDETGLVDAAAPPPPPPRNGFAMRPKLNGDDAAAL